MYKLSQEIAWRDQVSKDLFEFAPNTKFAPPLLKQYNDQECPQIGFGRIAHQPARNWWNRSSTVKFLVK